MGLVGERFLLLLEYELGDLDALYAPYASVSRL